MDHTNEAKVLTLNSLLRLFQHDDPKQCPYFFYCFWMRVCKLAEKKKVRVKDQETAYNESKLSCVMFYVTVCLSMLFAWSVHIPTVCCC